MNKRNIEVSYDGEYPCACGGTLIIKEDGKEIYNKKFCCDSTGSVCFDEDWNETVYGGNLIWDHKEAEKFDKEIQEKVREVLSEVGVCCGGCI